MSSRPKSSKTPVARKAQRKPPLVSLTGACAYFRVPGSGNPPSRGLLLYHMEQGHLRPDKKTAMPTGGFQYGFTRSTLQAFAREQGWKYMAKSEG